MQNFKNLLHAWRHTLYTLSYFALLAVFVPMASKRHMGTGGMFFAMALAAVLLLTCWGSIKLLSWKIAQSQITAAERRSWLSGAALLVH